MPGLQIPSDLPTHKRERSRRGGLSARNRGLPARWRMFSRGAGRNCTAQRIVGDGTATRRRTDGSPGNWQPPGDQDAFAQTGTGVTCTLRLILQSGLPFARCGNVSVPMPEGQFVADRPSAGVIPAWQSRRIRIRAASASRWDRPRVPPRARPGSEQRPAPGGAHRPRPCRRTCVPECSGCCIGARLRAWRARRPPGRGCSPAAEPP